MTTRATAWDLARAMVVQDGASYADVATATGLPLSTIQKRAARENWKAEAKTSVDYGTRVRELKNRALDAALAGSDPQLFYAWQAMEKAWPEHRYNRAENPAAQREAAVQMIEKLVEYLAEHNRVALAAIQPEIMPFGKWLEAQWPS